jgi:hypothetical protein
MFVEMIASFYGKAITPNESNVLPLLKISLRFLAHSLSERFVSCVWSSLSHSAGVLAVSVALALLERWVNSHDVTGTTAVAWPG